MTMDEKMMICPKIGACQHPIPRFCGHDKPHVTKINCANTEGKFKMRYCNDVDCPKLQILESNYCALGLKVTFRVPKSYQDIQEHNWGYLRPSNCKHDFHNSKVN